jgi:ribonuclease HII
VIAAAVIWDPVAYPLPVKDSKALTEKQRNRLFDQICEVSLAWAIGRAEVSEIDAINIFQASLLAMQRAVLALAIPPEGVWVDGTHCPQLPYPCEAFIKGDARIPVISAASILAKVTRDREMMALDASYPGYGFAQHKGYPTQAHRLAIAKQGILPIHRRSFALLPRTATFKT